MLPVAPPPPAGPAAPWQGIDAGGQMLPVAPPSARRPRPAPPPSPPARRPRSAPAARRP